MSQLPIVTGRRRRFGWLLARWTLVPAAVILLVRMSGCAERLFYHPIREPTPAPSGAPRARVVRFDSADGTALCGWFVPARGGGMPPRGGAPSLLFVHGNAGNMNSHWGFVEDLPGRGFNVLIFDYRGYGESEGSAWRRSPLVEDTRAALAALLVQPEVDATRVGVFAQSLGAALALNAFREPGPVRAMVLESPFASWRFAAATALGGGDPGVIARGAAALLIGDEMRPDDAIAANGIPVLILHGDADRIVPVEHGRLLRDAAPERVTLVEFPGGDHNSLRQSHPQATRLAIDFLREHLAPPASATSRAGGTGAAGEPTPDADADAIDPSR